MFFAKTTLKLWFPRLEGVWLQWYIFRDFREKKHENQCKSCKYSKNTVKNVEITKKLGNIAFTPDTTYWGMVDETENIPDSAKIAKNNISDPQSEK